MATDAFLQFMQGPGGKDIAGETQDSWGTKQKPPPFEITKWGFGASNPATISSATGGAGGGKVEFESFNVTKNIDKATPFLFNTCCVGGHFGQVSLAVRKAGGSTTASGAPYLQWDFKMVFVENITWSGGDDEPTEDIKFRYGAIQFTYSKQAANGTLTKASDAKWSQLLNAAEFVVPE